MGIKSYTGVGFYPKKKKNSYWNSGIECSICLYSAFSHVCILLYHGKDALVSHTITLTLTLTLAPMPLNHSKIMP